MSCMHGNGPARRKRSQAPACVPAVPQRQRRVIMGQRYRPAQRGGLAVLRARKPASPGARPDTKAAHVTWRGRG